MDLGEVDLTEFGAEAIAELSDLGRFFYELAIDRSEQYAAILRLLQEKNYELTTAEQDLVRARSQLRNTRDHSLDLERRIAGNQRVMLVNASIALKITQTENELERARLEVERMKTSNAKMHELIARAEGNNKTLLARLESAVQVAEERNQAMLHAQRMLEEQTSANEVDKVRADGQVNQVREDAARRIARLKAEARAEIARVRAEAKARIKQIESAAAHEIEKERTARRLAEHALNQHLAQCGRADRTKLEGLTQAIFEEVAKGEQETE